MRQKQLRSGLLLCAVLLALRFTVPPTIILGGLGQPPYLWSSEMADYLREHTTDDASLYVAYSGAHVVYLTGRRSAIPYLDAPHLFNIPGAYDALLATIRDPDLRPDYVLANPAEARGPGGDPDRRFMDLLDRPLHCRNRVRGSVHRLSQR